MFSLIGTYHGAGFVPREYKRLVFTKLETTGQGETNLWVGVNGSTFGPIRSRKKKDWNSFVRASGKA